MNGDERASFAAKLAMLRSRAGLSLAELGAAAHVVRGYVHHVEKGRRWPSAGVVKALDAALDADGALLAAWELGAERPRPVQRRPDLTGTLMPRTAPTAPTEAPLVDVVAVRTMAQALQAADRQVGGGRLYPSVLRYLHAEIAPALVDPRGDDGLGELFAAAASLTEIAGWMAHDGGQDDAARGHLSRAYRLAIAAGSDPLAANVCASMSHLAVEFGQAPDAVRIAEAGLDRARAADGVARLVGRLHAMRARGLTLRGQAQEATIALAAAERALGAADAEPAEWIAGFDEAALAGEAALCLLALGDLAAAERAAERVIELRDGDRVRSRAFGQLTLARVLVHAGRPDEAAAHGRAVCAVAPALSSVRVHRQLTGLGAALHLYRDATEVAEANESPRVAATRELGEELGLTVPLGRVLAIEWAPPHGPWDDQLVFVFDGATLPAERIAGLCTVDAELARLEFVPITDAAIRMRPDIWRRLQRAHAALRTGATDYYERTS